MVEKSLKQWVLKIREVTNLIRDIDNKLNYENLSKGNRDTLLKHKKSKIGILNSYVKKIDNLVNGNLILIDFKHLKDEGKKYRAIYTNINREDAILHLTTSYRLSFHEEITIIQVKEIDTKKSRIFEI